ncbi:hypothetical protein EV659_101117 [Rhodothalassium salexigens DSM 2132]|uniref:Uncharacterized protein n=1 Tax=Rhodothalassium salexigens DSM 2132 TaxID=1188247 RepID=A0A4R2PQX6_RHOSA|nr:hypothetical protein [Rhodothalassium salexigens]MBB4210054.1 hypothetical protein [Rhodothalassium salexigens DSM 2132]MBK1637576.1 hypothetical protein [Rhodothalassium salexigens DSM 2132]TCP38219.1 hypothetical protein EV659_101117 [Rhodothalassium salexigens DSM 2132]
MLKTLHAVAGALALATICTFWGATAITEAAGATAAVVMVKTWIPWGFFVLIPALMVAGGSGFRLGQGWRAGLVEAKRRRMPIIAINGLVILVPSALILSIRAQAGQFDTLFYAVQGVELLAGAANIVLLGMNMRDGLRLRRRDAVLAQAGRG